MSPTRRWQRDLDQAETARQTAILREAEAADAKVVATPANDFRSIRRQINAILVEKGQAPELFDPNQRPLESTTRGRRILDHSHEGTTDV